MGRRRKRTTRSPDGGFTLVELLVVVVVLGILAGIVVFGVGRFRADANAAACQADVAAVNAASDAYQAVTGSYPQDLTQLTVGQYLMSVPRSGTYAFDPATRTALRSPACAEPSPTAAATVRPSAAPGSVTAAPTVGATPVGTACAAAVSIDNSWPQGYQAAVTVTNRSAAAVPNWVATWTVPDGVTLNNGWNATVTQNGNTMRAEAPSWSATLEPGASWSIGFIANGPSSPPPSAVTLNGVGCA